MHKVPSDNSAVVDYGLSLVETEVDRQRLLDWIAHEPVHANFACTRTSS